MELRNMEKPILEAFGKRIKHLRFKEYCEFYSLDEEETKQELIKRGYIVLGDKRMHSKRLNVLDLSELRL